LTQDELRVVAARLDRLEADNAAMRRKIAENGQLLRALEETVAIVQAELAAKRRKRPNVAR
jgi:hypothetical protein